VEAAWGAAASPRRAAELPGRSPSATLFQKRAVGLPYGSLRHYTRAGAARHRIVAAPRPPRRPEGRTTPRPRPAISFSKMKRWSRPRRAGRQAAPAAGDFVFENRVRGEVPGRIYLWLELRAASTTSCLRRASAGAPFARASGHHAEPPPVAAASCSPSPHRVQLPGRPKTPTALKKLARAMRHHTRARAAADPLRWPQTRPADPAQTRAPSYRVDRHPPPN
jgi:hypothetical protein